MIDYETFVKIKVYNDQHGLKCSQIARELNLDYRTVEKWLDQKQYQQRKSSQRASKLDPFKGQIVRMLHTYPYTATQIFRYSCPSREDSIDEHYGTKDRKYPQHFSPARFHQIWEYNLIFGGYIA